jgi:hypothetical protein
MLFAFIWLGVKPDMHMRTNDNIINNVEKKTNNFENEETNNDENETQNSRFLSLRPLRYISTINVTDVKKKIDIQAVTTNSITSFKLLLSFYQIMTQVVSQKSPMICNALCCSKQLCADVCRCVQMYDVCSSVLMCADVCRCMMYAAVCSCVLMNANVC